MSGNSYIKDNRGSWERGGGGGGGTSATATPGEAPKYNPFRRGGGAGGGGAGRGRSGIRPHSGYRYNHNSYNSHRPYHPDTEEHKDYSTDGSTPATPAPIGLRPSASFNSVLSDAETASSMPTPTPAIPITPIATASGAGAGVGAGAGAGASTGAGDHPHEDTTSTPFSEMTFPPLYEGKTTFETWDDEVLAFSDDLLRGVYGYGFDTPSPIQRMSIIPIKYGRDIIAQAQSGTGKTGAFTLGTLSRIDITQPTTQAVILAPTRELSEQIHFVINNLGQYLKPKTALLIGGTSSADDSQRLRHDPPHIIVGCPGRINDMFKRGALSSEHIKLLVLDEADEMLSHGFNEQIYHIVRNLSKMAQIALFSATFPPELEPLTKKFMREPIRLLVEKETISLDGIHQYRVDVADDEQKYAVLKDIFKTIAMSQCIIYCNTVARVEILTRSMVEDGFPVVSIHSNMPTKERQSIIEDFKKGKQRVLVSSDITARGIDVQQVSVVLNFDIPRNKHTYLHRIGRCGRWGRKGVAINFVTRRDQYALEDIEAWYKIKIEELPVDFEAKIRRA